MEITFAAGGSIPQLGLGTYPMDDAEAERVIAEAIDMGYRLVDTAFAYRNETGVGRGLRAASVPREQVFVTTKFNRESHSIAGVAQAWEDSCRRLGLDYIDLMLIHWPNPSHDQFVQAWEGLIALREQGKVRHIGVSNFLPEHTDKLIAATGVAPDLDQIEVHPAYSQPLVREYNAGRGIVTQSWSPLAPGTGLLGLPLVTELADKYGCTPGQTVLAWHFALGLSAVPKSSNPARLAENLASQSVVLETADVERLAALQGSNPSARHLDPNSFGH